MQEELEEWAGAQEPSPRKMAKQHFARYIFKFYKNQLFFHECLNVYMTEKEDLDQVWTILEYILEGWSLDKNNCFKRNEAYFSVALNTNSDLDWLNYLFETGKTV